MARRRVVVDLESDLVDATRAVVRRVGVAEDELYERALRDVLASDFTALMDEIAADQAARGWSRATITTSIRPGTPEAVAWQARRPWEGRSGGARRRGAQGDLQPSPSERHEDRPRGTLGRTRQGPPPERRRPLPATVAGCESFHPDGRLGVRR